MRSSEAQQIYFKITMSQSEEKYMLSNSPRTSNLITRYPTIIHGDEVNDSVN